VGNVRRREETVSSAREGGGANGHWITAIAAREVSERREGGGDPLALARERGPDGAQYAMSVG